MTEKGGIKTYGLVWPAVNRVEIEEFEVPEPGPGELLLEAECTLISPGTERNWLTARNILPRGYPFRPGYSFAGRVKAMGPDVSGFKVGDPVVAAARHAAHVITKERRVFRVPDGVALESAVFFSLGTVAIEGLRRARVEMGESVVILGLGPIGLLALQIAKLMGALPVIGMDIIESRLKRGVSYGADIVVNSQDKEGLKKVLSGLDGGGPAVVIEVTAAQEPLDLALQMVRRLGRVILLSSIEGKVTLDLNSTVHMKGVYLIGAQTNARPRRDSRPGVWTMKDDMLTWLQLLQFNRLEVASLITHHFAWKDAPQAYELVKASDPGLIGAILHWH